MPPNTVSKAVALCFLFLEAVLSLPLAHFCESGEETLAYSSERTEHQRFEVQVQKAAVSQSQNFSVSSFSDSKPVASELFGNFRSFAAHPRELRPHVHPRVVFGKKAWNDLLAHHAESRRHGNEGTWSTYFERQTVWQGPLSEIIAFLAELEQNGITAVYDGRALSGTGTEAYRDSLKPLSSTIEVMNSTMAPSLILCSFWTGVSAEINQDFLPVYNSETCVRAMVAWSKILLAHRVYHCTPNCPFTYDDLTRSFLWNTRIPWRMRNDDYTAGASLALAYDTLYDKMSASERRIVRSALAMLVMNRFSWGICPVSSEYCPDAVTEPHKIFDKNAMYHSNLFLTNLAIEGEYDFDAYTTEVLRRYDANGFNAELHVRFLTLLKAYIQHAVYPDGSTVQDSSFYTDGLREGSLALVAVQRRGSNLLNTPRFRNVIHYASQIIEPWECGKLPGESSGAIHNAFVALFNFLYPESKIISTMWRQRIGRLLPKSCARLGWRSVYSLIFLAREPAPFMHKNGLLPASTLEYFPLNVYYAHRGLLVARTGIGTSNTHVHFDIRSDVGLDGRDTGGRGDLLFAGGGYTWLRSFGDHSREKTLIHIDGIAQELIAPPAKLLRIDSEDSILIAVADLTYAYNIQWARGREEQLQYNTAYDQKSRTFHQLGVHFSQQETQLPFSNISIPPNLVRRIWKRRIREDLMIRVIRSICLLSGGSSDVNTSHGTLSGSLIISDYVVPGKGSHLIESFFALSSGTRVINLSCSRNPDELQCALTLMSPSKTMAVLRTVSSVPLRAKTEIVGGKLRIIVSAEARRPIRIWTGVAAGDFPALKIRLLKEGLLVEHGRASRFLHATSDGGIRYARHAKLHTLQNGDFVVLNATSMKPILNERQTFEANLNVAAASRSEMDDVISTCGHKTSTRTHIHVFSCKNTTSQKSSDCYEVLGWKTPCSKSSGRQEWRGRLTRGYVYRVRIVVESIHGLQSVVEVRYRLRRYISRDGHR
ncbi:unnamed protein product [Agarophyton chilense]|eukprot:gb/GEZJ01002008.1/.p1 GENE.gb/GEZJ01002008.1/~~gb/GEZJ01002008.1/.p1  ORF type:complete len:993 (-),score=102.57 gb/GEZJ01002008.1/:792-3770(-)